jgi:hypothetical protein
MWIIKVLPRSWAIRLLRREKSREEFSSSASKQDTTWKTVW